MKHIMKNIDKDKIRNIWDNAKCVLYIILMIILVVSCIRSLIIADHVDILLVVLSAYLGFLTAFTVSIIREIKKDKRNK